MAAEVGEPPPREGMFASAVPAGRLFGVPVRVHWSAPLLVLLLAVNLGAGLLPAWVPGHPGGAYFLGAVLGALLLVVSLLGHEAAHAVTARHRGVPVTDMTVWALGGVTRMGRPATAGAQGRIAVSGPLASAGLGGLFLGAALAVLKGTGAELPGDVLLWLGWANLLLAGFNLVPAAPLDGGHVLESLVWARTGRRDRAEQVAARSGQVAGLALAAVGFVGMVRGSLDGLWLVVVGLFISMSAQHQVVERKVSAPLVPLSVLGKRSVAWGNVAGLIAFLTECSLVFPLTLYLQDVLGFSPLAAGLSFGVLGLGTVTGGVTAPKFIAKLGSKRTLIVGGLLQAVFTAALMGLGADRAWLWLMLGASFFGGVGNMLVIVGFMVTATSGLADHEQGLATGLATMTQQVGITMGTPIMSAVVTAAAGTGAAAVLGGLRVAIGVNAAIVVLGLLASAIFLRSDRPSAG